MCGAISGLLGRASSGLHIGKMKIQGDNLNGILDDTTV
jgi:hypothetical protein